MNWYGIGMPMHKVTMNPPLAGYYLAAVGALAGLSEVAVHTASFCRGGGLPRHLPPGP